jgi:hydrogenase maturation protease
MTYSTQPSILEPARITTFYGENLTPTRGDSTALQTTYRSAKGSQVAEGGDRRSEVAAGAAGSDPAAHRGAYAEILDHPTMQKRILIACIGNIFLGDDGFGVAVAQRLLSRKNKRYSDCVQVIDFGVRGIDLANTLLDGYGILMLVDAFPRGGQPGTLYLIEQSAIDPDEGWEINSAGLDIHRMDPVQVLAFARALGAGPVRTLFVGCEPAFPPDNQTYPQVQLGLSEPVQAAVEKAVELLDDLCLQFCRAEVKT